MSEDTDATNMDLDVTSNSVQSLKCTICLDEKETNIKKHIDCSFSLCDDCVVSIGPFPHFFKTIKMFQEKSLDTLERKKVARLLPKHF
jgi:hypothetical protein